MKSIIDHPALAATRAPFAPMRDIDRLAVGLSCIRHLDPTAVYHIVGDSTVAYYHSPHAEPGGVARIVLAPNGKHRRIDRVGFDPRTAIAA